MARETYTVVSTMKNEGPYIIDWVAHYKTLGFDHILVCTNDCSDPTVAVLTRLQDLGLVHHHPTIVRGAGIHRSALRQASAKYNIVKSAKWVFVCDVDEYLNIKIEDGSARALVDASGGNADVICVPWRIYGSNGVQAFQDQPVTEQFTLAELPHCPDLRPKTGKFVKSLYTNQDKFLRMGLHAPVSRPENLDNEIRVLPGGKLYTKGGARTENPPLFDVAQVNHYALRSMESFLIKRARGRANHSHHVLGEAYWDKFNLNEIADPTVHRYRKEAQRLASELKSDPVLGRLHAEAVNWHFRKAMALRIDPEMDVLRQTILQPMAA